MVNPITPGAPRPPIHERPGETILVAGGTGRLGRELTGALHRAGYRVCLLGRRAGGFEVPASVAEVRRGNLLDPASLAGAVRDITTVFSCAGASLDISAWRDRTSYERLDHQGNLNLLRAAGAAGVERFGYVSVLHDAVTGRTAYVRAHEAFVTSLRASGLAARVVRPTGYFSFFGEFVRMARRGSIPLIGDGSARTNPIHEADLAEVCVEALTGDREIVEAGGPQVFTRREIGALAFEAVGRRAQFSSVPPGVFRGIARMLRPVQPRLAALLAFGAEVSIRDCIGPARGARDLGHYFRDVAGRL